MDDAAHLRDAAKWTRRWLVMMVAFLVDALWFGDWSGTADKIVVSVLCVFALLSCVRLLVVEGRVFGARRGDEDQPPAPSRSS